MINEKIKHIIQAGDPVSFSRDSVDWILLDVGFAGRQATGAFGKTMGLRLPQNSYSGEVTWANGVKKIVDLCSSNNGELNLMLEAPLSASFDETGNPAPRKFEKRGTSTRYWYLQGGVVTLLSSAYLISELVKKSKCKLHLYEAFVSFKDKIQTHSEDADLMLNAAQSLDPLSEEHIRQKASDSLEAVTSRFGLDYGIPPVFII